MNDIGCDLAIAPKQTQLSFYHYEDNFVEEDGRSIDVLKRLMSVTFVKVAGIWIIKKFWVAYPLSKSFLGRNGIEYSKKLSLSKRKELDQIVLDSLLGEFKFFDSEVYSISNGVAHIDKLLTEESVIKEPS